MIRPVAANQTLEASDRLLSVFGCVMGMFEASQDDIDAVVPGAGPLTHAARDLAVELARGRLRGGLVNPTDPALHAYLSAAIGTRSSEAVIILYLDSNGRYLADDVYSSASAGAVRFEFRSILHRALNLRASALLLAHNHPSGVLTPSVDDIAITAEFERIARGVELVVTDHLIVGAHRVFSMRQDGLIGPSSALGELRL